MIAKMPAFCAVVILVVSLESYGDEPLDFRPIGTIGKAERVLKADAETVLYEHEGTGCLTHFWFGGNFDGVENTRIRYYVDGEEKPSIDMDLYMGHGIGFNDNHAPWATKHVGKIGKRNGLYYLEACMRAYLGESEKPLMLSSGLEDYFLGTYYFDTGRYYADIAGLTHFDRKANTFSAYRFHDDDPLFFDDGLRLTCRNGETEHGTAEGPTAYREPPTTRYTTYVWIYQW